MQNTLFQQNVPLAEKMRPKVLKDLIGVSEFSEANLANLQSMIFWGPPGCGKTSLAKIISNSTELKSISLSAVTSGSADFKEVFKQAEISPILLMIDEIHHLNKSQQDIFLPHLENGNIILIGTTTENPSFELRPALLSRCKVLIFKRLSNENLMQLIGKAETSLGFKLKITDECKKYLCDIADGDARYLINRIEEMSLLNTDHAMTVEELSELLYKKLKSYDKNADEHYKLISAFHKSLRGSDPDAALYWFGRMLEGGEDPLYIARRLVRAASEDVGNADPNALVIALSSVQAYQLLGSPEGELAIAQAVLYVATAPKSNAVYTAYNCARGFIKKTGTFSPPKHIINAPTKMMKEQGFCGGYIYDHDTPNAFSGQNYFPDEIKRRNFYKPRECGFEREIKKRLEWWNDLRCRLQKS